ncbi:major facilitator superfamily domain-containing protein [Macrophomina phaseolina]|uniref:Major facilitator superfamily domain-containing protein n=1 Tax=Macrophomina phaseolina TaxID=35725 RepID=A0ABQ8G751_9PEZI|nr:major facilitator superfamily domain-containing protein [Macrophomina phaseolina]
MATEEKTDAVRVEDTDTSADRASPHHREVHVKTIQEEAAEQASPLDLGWRTWLVVFLSSFTIMAQVYTTVAAASVVAFIAMDFEVSSLSGWIIQGPLLMQAALSPIVGRLSDILDRKYLASIPPLIAFVGAVVCAKATSMNMLIGGSILVGVTLSTIAIVQSIPSEILPLKYRAVANGIAFLGGASAGIIGQLSAGAYSHLNSGGWRYIFWTQAAFHLTSAIGFLAFYWPPRHSDFPRMKVKEYIWACDPIGSFLFIGSSALILLALDWAAGTYPWSDAHVIAPLVIGCVLLIVFGVYEWKARPDGLVAHVFFRSGPNFPLSVFAFAVEGWIFYSAVNAITPQMILRLGWEADPWRIAVRQLSYLLPIFFFSIPITWYATRFRDLRSPLLLCFAVFLATAIAYACVRPSWNAAQQGLNVLSALGQSGPLTLLVAAVQFTAPHAYLSTATGLAFSARAVGGAVGSAVLDAIVAARLGSKYTSSVTAAARDAGLAEGAVEALVQAMAGGAGVTSVDGLMAVVPGVRVEEVRSVVSAGYRVWAGAYRVAWASIVPFVVVACGCVAFLRGVRELMTERVEATVERTAGDRGGEGKGSTEV